MARGLNKVLLIGNVGRDPVVNTTASGQRVASFSLATSEEWNDPNGQRQSKTDWHNIVVWGNLAEIVGTYVHKGKQIYVEGRIQTRSYQDKNTGQDRYVTEIVANEILLLSGPAGQGGYQNNADISGRAGGNSGFGDNGYNGGYQNYNSGAMGGMNSAQRGPGSYNNSYGNQNFNGQQSNSGPQFQNPSYRNQSATRQDSSYGSRMPDQGAGRLDNFNQPVPNSGGRFDSQSGNPQDNVANVWSQVPMAPNSRRPEPSVSGIPADNTISSAVNSAASATGSSIEDDEDIPF
jgi:single-strand DNA-binding protein